MWIEPKDWEVPLFELGYFLDTGFQGKGYATEAARATVRWIFEELDAHKVIIETHDTNEPSWKLAQRLGFVREGHFRECEVQDDEYVGLYYYGMLRPEFIQQMS
jgi:RimJ/RimL family protein N-acetyltransferase